MSIFSLKSSFFFQNFFFRYVGDGRDSDNEILENIRPRTTEGKDDRGSYVTQEINWGPTREELCNYRDLVSQYNIILALKLFMYLGNLVKR